MHILGTIAVVLLITFGAIFYSPQKPKGRGAISTTPPTFFPKEEFSTSDYKVPSLSIPSLDAISPNISLTKPSKATPTQNFQAPPNLQTPPRITNTPVTNPTIMPPQTQPPNEDVQKKTAPAITENAYEDTINRVLKEKFTTNTPSIIALLDRSRPNWRGDIETTIKIYDAAVAELQSIVPPLKYKEFHKELLSFLTSTRNILEAIGNYEQDLAKAASALNELPKIIVHAKTFFNAFK